MKLLARQRRFVAAVTFLTALTLLRSGSAALPGVPAAPPVDAVSYILVDYASGDVLAESAADTRIEPASLTKMMTVYVAADELRRGSVGLDDEVVVSEKAWKTGGSRMFIEVGKRVSVSDLLRGIIVQSGNDASVALAEHVSGDESVFVALMNQHAARLGMQNSSFANSTGLPDPDTYTTAADLAVLSAALIRDFPDLYAWFAEPDFTYNNIRQSNRNSLLGIDDSVDGIKTGHTEAAGYCLVASALRDEMRLISVVTGSASESARTRASQALLNYGFRFFESHRLYDANEPIAESRVWKGATDNVPVGTANALVLAIPRGRYDDLQASVQLSTRTVAPVAIGDTQGQLTITLEDQTLKAVPLVALDNVARGGVFDRLVDHVLLMFE